MGKAAQKIYYCSECGTMHRKWQGQCDGCQAWNSLVEEVTAPVPINSAMRKTSRDPVPELVLFRPDGEDIQLPRTIIGLSELDRVLGGGLVPGSVTLIGGDPGIGKSTLLTQCAAFLARQDHRVTYISGEEAVSQIRMRARRLKLVDAPIELASETSLRTVLTGLKKGRPPTLLILDSIQTLWSDAIESAPGTVSQLRAVVQDLVAYAKSQNVAVILVGHVTKEGQIAGPRVVEHMVDTVLYFEGDRSHQYRILRAVKNRFGPVDEIGVFEMLEEGLSEVANPSALFLGDRSGGQPGTSVFAAIEGTRPILVEIQALVVSAAYGTPRRSVVGWDSGRMSMILAVLEARADMNFSGFDVFLNVVGGMKISEPAADLAVACALGSALMNISLPANTVYFGEVSLSGGIRPVRRAEARLKEAEKLGFDRAIVPDGSVKKYKGIRIGTVSKIHGLSGFIQNA
ncbi:MAG: DNA repair protein RadA [Pseudomonadota bacterium]